MQRALHKVGWSAHTFISVTEIRASPLVIKGTSSGVSLHLFRFLAPLASAIVPRGQASLDCGAPYATPYSPAGRSPRPAKVSPAVLCSSDFWPSAALLVLTLDICLYTVCLWQI
jgi:hypothetical protein